MILGELLKATIDIGGRLYRIGRKAVEISIVLATSFPTITFALILTTLLNLLIAAIPVLGPILVPVVGPLITALGVAFGVYKEITNPELKERMDELVLAIKGLFSAAVAPKPA